MFQDCVIDASMGVSGAGFCFCPIDGDIEGEWSMVTGINFLSWDPPPGMTLLAIVHPDGNDAVEMFCEQYEAELRELERAAATAAAAAEGGE